MAIGIRIKLAGVTSGAVRHGARSDQPRSHAAERAPLSRIRADRRWLGDHRLLGVPRRLRRVRGAVPGRNGGGGRRAAGATRHQGVPGPRDDPPPSAAERQSTGHRAPRCPVDERRPGAPEFESVAGERTLVHAGAWQDASSFHKCSGSRDPRPRRRRPSWELQLLCQAPKLAGLVP